MWCNHLVNKLFSLEEINGHGTCPTYLFRWTLFRLGDYACYLHHFVGDDWSRDFHDHPKRFVSIGLKGSYVEESPAYAVGARVFTAPWVRTFPAEHKHRLRLRLGSDCWTLVFVGRKTREWGFWHGTRFTTYFIPWRQYVADANLVEKVKSC